MKVAVDKPHFFTNTSFESTLAFVHHCSAKKSVYLVFANGKLARYDLGTKATTPEKVELPTELNRHRIGSLTDTKLWFMDTNGKDKSLRTLDLTSLTISNKWALPSVSAVKEANIQGNEEEKIGDLIMDTKVLCLPESQKIVTMERVERASDAVYVVTAYDASGADSKDLYSQIKYTNNKNFWHFDAVNDTTVAVYAQEIEAGQADVPITLWELPAKKENNYVVKNSEKIVGTIVNVKELDDGKKRIALFVNVEAADQNQPDDAKILLTDAGTIQKTVRVENTDNNGVFVPCLVHSIIHVYPKDMTCLMKLVEETGNKVVLYNYNTHKVLASFYLDDETDHVFSMVEHTLIQAPPLLADPAREGEGSKQVGQFLTTLFVPKEILSIFYMLNAREKEGGQTFEDIYKTESVVGDAFNLLAEKKASTQQML